MLWVLKVPLQGMSYEYMQHTTPSVMFGKGIFRAYVDRENPDQPVHQCNVNRAFPVRLHNHYCQTYGWTAEVIMRLRGCTGRLGDLLLTYTKAPILMEKLIFLLSKQRRNILVRLGVVRWCEGAVYLRSPGRPTDIGLQLGKACYPCSG